MQVTIVSLFPEFFESPLRTALLGRAIAQGLLDIDIVNIRDFATDARKTVDDIPYGGGAGMVLQVPVLDAALQSITNLGRIIMPSPSGTPVNQTFVEEVARYTQQGGAITFLCGRYEGIDARLFSLYPIEEICFGDVVLNGGEVAALALIEAIARFIPNFLGKQASLKEESFCNNLLEYPQYTRPPVYRGIAVPSVLSTGNHAAIAEWRREESLKKTRRNRPDLLSKALLTKRDRALLSEQTYTRNTKNLYVALVHFPVLGKDGKSIAVSLTNLDIHDIARCTCTYGLGGYYITTPLAEQQRLFYSVVSHWRSGERSKNKDRSHAMERVYCCDTICDAIDAVSIATGERPFIVATCASAEPTVTYEDVRAVLAIRPVLILFGTSHGLAGEVYTLVDAVLPPIRWIGGYNHLSVRSAVAITVDRIACDYF